MGWFGFFILVLFLLFCSIDLGGFGIKEKLKSSFFSLFILVKLGKKSLFLILNFINLG